jgi:hypothetical protein
MALERRLFDKSPRSKSASSQGQSGTDWRNANLPQTLGIRHLEPAHSANPIWSRFLRHSPRDSPRELAQTHHAHPLAGGQIHRPTRGPLRAGEVTYPTMRADRGHHHATHPDARCSVRSRPRAGDHGHLGHAAMLKDLRSPHDRSGDPRRVPRRTLRDCEGPAQRAPRYAIG